MKNEKAQKKLYQEKYNKALLAKTEQMKRLLIRDTFASAIRRAKTILKQKFSTNVDFETFVYIMFFLSLRQCEISLPKDFQEFRAIKNILTPPQHVKLNNMLVNQARAFRSHYVKTTEASPQHVKLNNILVSQVRAFRSFYVKTSEAFVELNFTYIFCSI